jgi:N-methylhydantoinase A
MAEATPFPRSYAVAVDIGGTFTDRVAVDRSTGEFRLTKCPSVPRDFVAGVRAVLEDLDDGRIVQFRHGTTVGTNAIIQRTGARTGLITTAGFRDVLIAGRASRPELYNSDWDPPPPLVQRRDIVTVTERVDYRGRVVTVLDEDEVRDAVRTLSRQGVAAVAICFLNAFMNPRHELRTLEIVREEWPEAFACASTEVVPEIREFERASTTVVNAYLGQPMADYLGRLEAMLGARLEHRVLVTHSGGGLMSSESARRMPARICQSGPAAGVMGGLAVAQRVGRRNVITLDMGGTSADISVIVDSVPMMATQWDAEFNVPVIFPAIDLVTIGAGGGTVAWVDSTGTPHSGPESAGAEPGPACYQRGGDRPTNTDANLVLGRLRPSAFMGGNSEIEISVEAGRGAIERTVASPLGTSVIAAAAGILRLSNASMINAIRLMTVQRGYDPRDFALVAFGGAGALHAADLAHEMGIPEVIVPTHPGLVSAIGALRVDLRYDFVRPVFQKSATLDSAVVARAAGELRAELERGRASDTTVEDWEVAWFADLRYYGQISAYLRLPISEPAGLEGDWNDIVARFRAAHEREFGYALPPRSVDVEFVNLRAVLVGHVEPAPLPSRLVATADSAPVEHDAYFLEVAAFRPTQFVDRETLGPGDVIQGPAIIEEWDSTTVVPSNARAQVAEHGELVIQIGRKRP